MASRYEQIGQSAGHQQTVGVLVEPAIALLGKAEHPLDDPIECSTLARIFDWVRFFARSISSTTQSLQFQ
jgi:hypothetical protein